MRYLVATVKPWNVEAFQRRSAAFPGEFTLVTRKEDLTSELVAKLEPRYIFFPHWSWLVPRAVLEAAECVCFHMTDVPYGRGGSPLQNLIARGHETTMLSALRMVEELDAGPIYGKRPLDLSGSAQEIFERAAELVYDLVDWMVRTEPNPEPQVGDVVRFRRRTPAMSALPVGGTERRLYDHIRMLDADTYPRAFLHHGEWQLIFSEASLVEDGITARVHIKRSKSSG
jgi:methionyl-tRNA formyltransferase